MSSPYPNQGVYLSGANNSTVRRRYPTSASGVGDVPARLDRLAELIVTHATAIPEWEHAIGDVRDVKTILGHPQPDRVRLRDTLARLAGRVSGAAPVATAVAEVTNLLR